VSIDVCVKRDCVVTGPGASTALCCHGVVVGHWQSVSHHSLSEEYYTRLGLMDLRHVKVP